MQKLSFVALDVETANPNMASICQIGLVEYVDGCLVHEWKSYVDPEDYFDGVNVSIHGITEATVSGSPTLLDLGKKLCSMLSGKVAVCHTHFDRVAIGQACRRYAIAVPDCSWLDSARVARRTWADCAWKGYGLSPVSKMLGFQFKHHDALEDAKASAHILIKACEEKGLDIDGWLSRVRDPVVPGIEGGSASIRREGNPAGELAGEVTKKTTILVVGDQDISKFAGHDKSSKHRKAEELIAEGVSMKIIGESDFKELVRLTQEYA